MLLACLAAGRWIERGKRRDAIFAGAACGLAVGMVLSSVAGLIILPVMIFLRRATSVVRLATLAISLGIAALSYALTNPYVPIHLVTDPAVLKSNLGNTRQMYAINGVAELFRNGGVRLLEAASVPVLGLGLIAIIIVLARRRPVAPLAVLLTSVSIVIVAQFFAFAGGKPGEYGRFAIFPVVALSIVAVWGLSLVKWQSVRFTCFVLAPASVAVFGAWPYFQAFLADTRPTDTRSLAAAQLASSSLNNSETLQVFADPAPYSMPPVDLWKWHILLSDPAAPLTGDVVVRPVDYPPAAPAPEGYRRMMIPGEHRPAPITWADKPIEILIRE
jgi:hypothetical protein